MPEWIAPVISFATVVTVLGLAVKYGEWKGKVDSDRKSIEGFSEWKGKVDSERTNFKEFMAEVREDIKEILGTLREQKALTLRRGSRLQLTELGEKIALQIGADTWAERLVPVIREKEGAEGRKNAYEVQEICIGYVRRLDLPNVKRALIQGVAFDNGLRERQVRDVLAIVLRDKFLKHHPPPPTPSPPTD